MSIAMANELRRLHEEVGKFQASVSALRAECEKLRDDFEELRQIGHGVRREPIKIPKFPMELRSLGLTAPGE